MIGRAALLRAGGGLIVAAALSGCVRRFAFGPNAGDGKAFAPNAWIRIDPDDKITVIVDKSEMGQGVYTSLPMLVAEELEVDPLSIRVLPAPADPVYINAQLGEQLTGESTSVSSSWEPLSHAAAVARTMLIAAAADTWSVPIDQCSATGGAVVHAVTGKRLTYGALASKAATMTPDTTVRLKSLEDYQVIGKRIPRTDIPAKVDGTARFGIDVTLPGMLCAVVARCPTFGGRVASFDGAQAERVAGVRRVLEIGSGVAVVADHYWAAKRGRDALRVKWDPGRNAGVNSAGIFADFARLAQAQGKVVRRDGDAEQAIAAASHRLDATYEFPFLAHATMEPMNATADVGKESCDLWAPTQNQTVAQAAAALVLRRPPSDIDVHTTLLGGGFGRRLECDFVFDAVELSAAMGAPVKVIYSREDDIQHDFYRPAYLHTVSAGLGADGLPAAWMHRIVGPSIYARYFPPYALGGIDKSSIEGVVALAYGIPNVLVDYTMRDTGVPVGFWRSVGHSHGAFVIETFIDELASAAGRDPVEYRRTLLRGSPRALGVLDLAAASAGWSSAPPRGRARGVAVHASFGTFVAQIAEISVEPGGQIAVHRVVCAVDCGRVVNPDTVEAQMEGGIAFGLSAALKGEITIDGGAVQQRNFNDYRVLRMPEMPEIDVRIVASADRPGGVGEPGTPPIAAAVANALFVLTGERIRRLPIQGRAGRP